MHMPLANMHRISLQHRARMQRATSMTECACGTSGGSLYVGLGGSSLALAQLSMAVGLAAKCGAQLPAVLTSPLIDPQRLMTVRCCRYYLVCSGCFAVVHEIMMRQGSRQAWCGQEVWECHLMAPLEASWLAWAPASHGVANHRWRRLVAGARWRLLAVVDDARFIDPRRLDAGLDGNVMQCCWW